MKLKYLLSGVVLAFTSCIPNIHSGRIVEMKHEPERRYDQLDSTQIGKMTFYHTNHMVDDEDWIINFEGEINKEKVMRRIYATKQFYSEFQVGDDIDLRGYVEKPVPFENYDFDREEY